MDNFFPLLEGDYGQLVFPPFIVGMISEPLVRAHSMHRWRRTKPDDQQALTLQCKILTEHSKRKEANDRREERQRISEENKRKRDELRNANKRAKRPEKKMVCVSFCVNGCF